MTTEQIAVEVGLEEIAVKACLSSYSSLYNDQMSSEKEEEDISDEEFAQIKMAYKQLMFSEDDRVKEKALRFLWDEKKGRNKQKDTLILNAGKINILAFNDRLIKARQAKEKFLNSNNASKANNVENNSEIIDVPSSISSDKEKDMVAA